MSVSIIIPTYNRAKLIHRTLDSINKQTSSEWECIVVDDFSVDETKQVVEKFVNNNNKFSYYLNTHKKGAQGARNTGVEHAKYDWVIFFDSDNLMHNDFIEKMIPNLSSNIDVCACLSDIVDIVNGKTGRVMNPNCNGYIRDYLYDGRCYVDFNQAVINKGKLFQIGLLDEDCPSMQEWDTHLRLSSIAKYKTIDNSLIDYYVGGNDRITANPKREVIGRMYILRKHIEEWKKRPGALNRFSYMIYRFIKKNEDVDFIKEKVKELKTLVPLLYVRMFFFIVQLIWFKIFR